MRMTEETNLVIHPLVNQFGYLGMIEPSKQVM